jgi:signal peptidase complex subunit 2
VTERVTISSKSKPSTKEKAPSYALDLMFVRSAASGKSLLGKAADAQSSSYTAFFDANGVMDQVAFEKWVGDLVGRAMEKADWTILTISLFGEI